MGVALTLLLSAVVRSSNGNPSASEEPQSAAVAVVFSMHGQAFVRRGKAKSQESLNAGDVLNVGDKVLCGGGAWFEVQQSSESSPLPKKTFKNHLDWLDIEAPIRHTFSQSVFDRLGRIAGAELGSTQMLIYPANDSVVRIEKFELIWPRFDQVSKVAIAISGFSGNIWIGSTKISNMPFRDPDMTSALHEATRTPQSFQATVLSDSGGALSRFTILSQVDEKLLEKELKAWRALRPEPLLLKMGEAQILAGYRLFNESADKWIEVTKLAPKGHYVLRKAIVALARIGNTEQEQRYRSKLKKLSP